MSAMVASQMNPGLALEFLCDGIPEGLQGEADAVIARAKEQMILHSQSSSGGRPSPNGRGASVDSFPNISDEVMTALKVQGASLMEMGYTAEEVTAATIAAGLNVDLTLDYVLNGIPEHLKAGD